MNMQKKEYNIALDEFPSRKKTELDEYSRFIIYNFLTNRIFGENKKNSNYRIKDNKLIINFEKTINAKNVYQRIKKIIENNEDCFIYLFPIRGLFEAVEKKEIKCADIFYKKNYIEFTCISNPEILIPALKTHFFSPIDSLESTYGDYFIKKESQHKIVLEENNPNSEFSKINFYKYQNFSNMIIDYFSGKIDCTCNTFFKYNLIDEFKDLNITSSRLNFYLKVNKKSKNMIRDIYNLDREKIVKEIGKGITPLYSNLKGLNFKYNLKKEENHYKYKTNLSYYNYYPNKMIANSIIQQLKIMNLSLIEDDYFEINKKKGDIQLLIIPNYGIDDIDFFYLEGAKIIFKSNNNKLISEYLKLLIDYKTFESLKILKKLDLIIISQGYIPLFNIKNLYLANNKKNNPDSFF